MIQALIELLTAIVKLATLIFNRNNERRSGAKDVSGSQQNLATTSSPRRGGRRGMDPKPPTYIAPQPTPPYLQSRSSGPGGKPPNAPGSANG